MNKTLTSWLSVVVVFLCLPLYAFTSGDGTYENPYEIAGQSDIVNLIDMVATNDCSGLYFLQTADIDLSVFGNFQGIGSISADASTTNAFSGNYDGDGYIFTNLYISAIQQNSDTCFVSRGLFNAVVGATLANISVYGYATCAFVRSASATSRRFVYGSVVASAKGNTLLENISSYVNIEASDKGGSSALYSIGGVCGRFIAPATALTWATIKNYGSIKYTALGAEPQSCIGGVLADGVFSASSTKSLVGLYNYGKISADCQKGQAASNRARTCVGGLMYGSGNKFALKGDNYGEIDFKGSGRIGGVCNLINNNTDTPISGCSNYGQINVLFNRHGANSVGGVIEGQGTYDASTYCTNFANISVAITGLSNANSENFVSGVSAYSGVSSAGHHLGFANYGNVDVVITNNSQKATAHIGGLFVHTYVDNGNEFIEARRAVNYGNISVRTDGASDVVGVGGFIATSTSSVDNERSFRATDCINHGSVALVVPNDFSGLAALSGFSASKTAKKNDVVLSNCYNLGSLKWSGRKIYVGGLMGLAEATTANTEFTHLRNCYSVGEMEGETEGNFVGSLVGCVSNVLGAVSISNCFAISQYPAFGAFYGGSTNNNVASYTYEQFYRNPNSQAFLYNYAFTNSGRDTNSFYDLALPINKLLFPTITEEIKQKHNWTRLNGYKRYIRTIQQQ